MNVPVARFKVRDKVLCHKHEDPQGTFREGMVLDLREHENHLEYYIRYTEYNKRLDEWTSSENVKKYTSKEKNIIRPVPRTDNGTIKKQTRASGLKNMALLEKKGEYVGGPPANVETETLQRTKNIENITIGEYDINVWYYSPFPGRYGTVERLYMCEHCLKYMAKPQTYKRHVEKCPYHFPPGMMIYKDEERHLAFFEVDGEDAKMYCQSLCLLSKMFLDHKTLYYDVEPFYFYVLCEYNWNEKWQGDDYHIVGYFSKEKASPDGYNLSCLMVLPHHQRKGYGKMLISMSYELSKIEGIPGSPEKPLSDLGLVSFKSYWTASILEELFKSVEIPSIQELTLKTGIIKEDCVSTLDSLGLIVSYRGTQQLVINKKKMEHLREVAPKKLQLVKKALLHWKPHSVVIKYPDIVEQIKTYC